MMSVKQSGQKKFLHHCSKNKNVSIQKGLLQCSCPILGFLFEVIGFLNKPFILELIVSFHVASSFISDSILQKSKRDQGSHFQLNFGGKWLQMNALQIITLNLITKETVKWPLGGTFLTMPSQWGKVKQKPLMMVLPVKFSIKYKL